MSDEAIERLIASVDRLTIATGDLASAFSAQPSRPTSEAAPNQSQAGAFALVIEELAKTPFPEHFSTEVARTRYLGPEDGPGSVPGFVFRFVEGRLSKKSPEVAERAKSAYTAGFWSSVALSTHTEYTPREATVGLNKKHWVVLRSEHPNPFRTVTKRDFQRIAPLADQHLICEVFETLAEVEVYCLAAGVPIPALLSCSNRN